MFRLKSPALAGLFFALFVGTGETAAGKLSTPGQQYFRSFIEAFTPLVLKREKKGGNHRWGEKNRDCAGLVRYLFWEALQPHSESFFDAYPGIRRLAGEPNPREFNAIETDWAALNFTAPQLIRQANFMGRTPEVMAMKTGDFLYFQSAELKIRHVMLVIRSGRELYLVYHTGDARNELKIRTFADINALPESEWHIETSNPVFRGIYRPRFLE